MLKYANCAKKVRFINWLYFTVGVQIVVSGGGKARPLCLPHSLAVFSCSYFFAPISQWPSLNPWKRQAKCKSMKGRKCEKHFFIPINNKPQIRNKNELSYLFVVWARILWLCRIFHCTRPPRLIRHANDFSMQMHNSHARRKSLLAE